MHYSLSHCFPFTFNYYDTNTVTAVVSEIIFCQKHTSSLILVKNNMKRVCNTVCGLLVKLIVLLIYNVGLAVF